MGSITKIGNSVRVRVKIGDGCLDIRLKLSKAEGKSVTAHIEHLVRCKQSGEEPRAPTRHWVSDSLPAMPKLQSKLIQFGLVNNGQALDRIFTEFIEEYIRCRKDVKSGTTKQWRQALRNAQQFFPGRTIRSLTVADGKDFLRWLETPKPGGAGLLGESPSKRLGHIRTFLNHAVDSRIIGQNPFSRVKARRTSIPGRKVVIPESEFLRLLDSAPSAEWCCFLAMSFYGGLRTPSEHKALTWNRIRFNDGDGMMTVISPKTERQGKASREVPIFAELRPFLEDLYDCHGYPAPSDPVFPVLG